MQSLGWRLNICISNELQQGWCWWSEDHTLRTTGVWLVINLSCTLKSPRELTGVDNCSCSRFSDRVGVGCSLSNGTFQSSIRWYSCAANRRPTGAELAHSCLLLPHSDIASRKLQASTQVSTLDSDPSRLQGHCGSAIGLVTFSYFNKTTSSFIISYIALPTRVSFKEKVPWLKEIFENH